MYVSTDYLDTVNDNILRTQQFKIICMNKNETQVIKIY